MSKPSWHQQVGASLALQAVGLLDAASEVLAKCADRVHGHVSSPPGPKALMPASDEQKSSSGKRLRAERPARRSERRWRSAFDSAPVAMVMVDLSGQMIDVNPAMSALVGVQAEDLIGKPFRSVLDPRDVSGAKAEATLVPGTVRFEQRLVRSDGRLVWCELSSSVVRDSAGCPDHVLTHVVDVTDRKRSEVRLRRLAARDPLTGLANRRSFEAELEHHVSLVHEGVSTGALLVIDLDNFKAVNDTFGHQAGDRLIARVAEVLRSHLRDADVVGRLGGDEFAVLLPNAEPVAAEAVARKLVLAVRDELASVGGLSATASIGVAMFGQGSAKEMLVAADMAMYETKRSGRNGYSIHGSGRGPRHARPAVIRADGPGIIELEKIS